MLSILHAADLHLDSPFSALSAQQAKQRRLWQRQLPDKLTELCQQHGCDLMLLAGDVFDGSRVCPETIEALQQAFSRCRAEIFISPGNHDPYTDTSPWAAAVWPDNVHIFTGAMTSVDLPQLGCRVWGAAFCGAVAWELLQPISPREDRLEIGVFHGDPVYNSSYHPITAAQLRQSGLDYLALGHIHKRAELQQASGTHYTWPGAAMGRGFDEVGVCGAYLVHLSKIHCSAEFLPLPGPRYEVFRIGPQEDPAAVLPDDSSQVIARLIYHGQQPAPNSEQILHQLAGRCFALEIRDETVPPSDIWAQCGTNTLRGHALSQLQQQYQNATSAAQRQHIALAAQYVLAALEGRELP